jgi:TnpA family transposase
MTGRQRDQLLALPTTEDEVVRHYSFSPDDLAAIAQSRMPETRLGYALQLCCLRYPGRYLRRGELLPGIMLDHIAEQVGADREVIALFARRGATRYDQLVAIKQRHGYRDFTRPARGELAAWAQREAIGVTNGRVLLDRLFGRIRAEQIIIPGVSVIERMAATAMHAADAAVAAEIGSLLSDQQCMELDALLSNKTHIRQSRLSWLREPPSRVGSRPLLELLDKLALVRTIVGAVITTRPELAARMAQMAREGSLHTAQAFQQMGSARRYAVMMATLSELAITLTDAALTMFQSLVGRANLRARKRLEGTIAASDEQGRTRLIRIADVLETLVKTARKGGDIAAAVTLVATLDVVEADAAIIRRTVRPGRPDVLGELSHEHRVFKQIGARFLANFTFQGRRASQPLLAAMAVLSDLGGDWRKPLPANLPLAHIERRWYRHVFQNGSIDRTYYELATFFTLANALASGDVWVPASRVHRSLDTLLTPASPATNLVPARLPTVPAISAEIYIEARAGELDAALLATAHGLPGKDAAVFTGGKLRFPKEQKDIEAENAAAVSASIYRLMPRVRITDMLDQVVRWTGFTDHFGHVSTSLPPADTRAFMATLIAEATNLGLSRMAEVCGAGSRRALLRMQMWHMREDTFRAALACLTDAIHAEPLSAWFGEGWRASADGQAFYLGGPGEAGGAVNAHYGRDPIVKIYTTITDRYAPLYQKVIAGTAGEAIHSLDGILGHESTVNVVALHVDGGGVSDIVFAVMHLLGLSFEPRIPRLSDRRLYAFEPKARYGGLAPLFGHRLDAGLIRAHWDDIQKVIHALRNRVVTPSLILKKLSAYRQQNSLAAALREIGRIERTLFTLRWFEDPELRRLVTGELNKGEAKNSLSRAVAFHRLGRFRDRGHENQTSRAAALNLVTAAIILFNCRYIGRAVEAMRQRGTAFNERLISQLSPLGWDHINITGDYVWSDSLVVDSDGFLPLRIGTS